MSNIEAVKNQLAAKPQTTSLQALIEKSAKELGRALPEHLSPDRLVRIALTCIRLNPELAVCTPDSFLGSLFVLAQLGLEPVNGRAYLLPFNNKRKINGEWKSVKEVQAVIGYKGLVDLFYNHPAALSLDMQVVYANDHFDYQFGTDGYIKHTPALKERGESIAYYAVGKTTNGGKVFFVMSKAEVLTHAKKHAKTYDRTKGEFYSSSPWAKEFDAMGLKTVLIQLSKRMPAAVLSPQLRKAIDADETSRDYRAGIDEAMDLPVTTTWEEAAEQVADDKKPEAAQ
jgi:recombination protein RecT